MLRWITLTGLLWFAAPAMAAENEDPQAKFRALVAANAREVVWNDPGLEGDGARWLVEQAQSARVFIVGEQHATRDIARFSHALLKKLQPAGYRKLAMEIGPWSTRFAERLMRTDPKGFEAFMSSEETYLALPFLFYREEADLVFSALAADDSPPTLWGLDQEFVAAAPIVLPELRRLAQTDPETAAVEAAQAAAADNEMYVGTVDASELAKLREAFAARGDPAALELIDGLVISNRIYRPFTGRGGTSFEANLERENYMKARYVDAHRAWQQSDPEARVFLKFGAFHGSRGRSGTQVPALGDFLVEWGRTEGLPVFNLHIDCAGGQARDIRSGEATPCSSYYFAGDENLLLAAAGDGLKVIDLRPLRPYAARMAFLDPATVNLIYAYDAYLALPDVAPATTFR